MKKILSYFLMVLILASVVPTVIYADGYSAYIGAWRGEGGNAYSGVDILSTDGNTMNFKVTLGGEVEYDVNNAIIQGNLISGSYYKQFGSAETGFFDVSGFAELTLSGSQIILKYGSYSSPEDATYITLKQTDYTCFIGDWYNYQYSTGVTISSVSSTSMDFTLWQGRFGITECKNAKVTGNTVTYDNIYSYGGQTYTDKIILYLNPHGVELMINTDITGPVYYTLSNPNFVYKVKEYIPPVTPDKITVTVNGTALEFDQEPVIVNGRTLVPIRKICDAIGAEIYYRDDSGIKIINIAKGNTLIMMAEGVYSPQIGGIPGSWRIDKFTVPDIPGGAVYIDNYTNTGVTLGQNGQIAGNENSIMEVQPVILSGRTCVPVRVLTEYLGAEVNWDDTSRTVQITMPNTTFDRSEEMRSYAEIFTYDMAYISYSILDEYDYASPVEMYEVFTAKGFAYKTSLDDKYTVLLYPDYTADYFDTATGSYIKTVDLKG